MSAFEDTDSMHGAVSAQSEPASEHRTIETRRGSASGESSEARGAKPRVHVHSGQSLSNGQDGLSLADLVRLLASLRGAQARMAMRWRMAPARQGLSHDGKEADAAADAFVTDAQVGLQAAVARGLQVAAVVPSDTFMLALKAAWDNLLLRRISRPPRIGRRIFSALVLQRRRWRLAAFVGGVLCFLAIAVGSLVMEDVRVVALLLGLGIFLPAAFIRLEGIRYSRARLPRKRLTEKELPVYSVLVPVYREVAVLDQLLAALQRLRYPREKLDIKIIVEEHDTDMRLALSHRMLPSYMEVLVVPAGHPRTKPRALNYALPFCRGELVCIYDAEDVPAPDQLWLAAETFAAMPASVACLQARLGWYNAGHSWLTGMIEIEYAAHFDVLLPNLARRGWPLPLGGTSNHFRIAALRAAGAWDAWNVTEDADLGLRLARMGYHTATLDSYTGEEACTSLRDWLGQRTRWIKGWLQTWLVHLQAPWQFWQTAGAGGMFVLHALIGASVLSALGYPLLLALFLWWWWMVPDAQTWSGHLLDWLYAIIFIAGHMAAIMTAMAGLCRRQKSELVRLLPLLPFYWLLVSWAAWRAVAELLRRPFHWFKTPHGHSPASSVDWPRPLRRPAPPAWPESARHLKGERRAALSQPCSCVQAGKASKIRPDGRGRGGSASPSPACRT